MFKKITKISAVAALTVTSCLGTASTVFAKEVDNGKVHAKIEGNKVSIGNGAIEREFSIDGNKLKTKKINNKMGNKEYIPAEGSEEFIINLLKENNSIEFKKPGTLTSVKPKEGPNATIEVSSTYNETGVNANNVIDNNPNTHWASNEEGLENAYLKVNLGEKKEFSKIVYSPRVANGSTNCTGRIDVIKLTFDDNESTTKTFEFENINKKVHEIDLGEVVNAQRIKIEATKTYHWNNEQINKAMNIAEIDVLDQYGSSLIHEGWNISGTSVQNNDGQGYNALIDGNPSTYYHSKYTDNGEGTTNTMPIDITLDRGVNSKDHPFQTFGYRPRDNRGQMANGNILEYEIYVSNNKDDLFRNVNNKKITSRYIYTNGVFEGVDTNFFYHSFDEEQTGRFVGLRVLSGHGGNFAAGSEIDLFAESFDTFNKKDLNQENKVKTSDLQLKGNPVITKTEATINNVKKTGQMITFNFETHKGIDVTEKVVMYDGDHFMRKFMEIKFSDLNQRIDYIDCEHLVVNSTDKTWSIPHAGGIVEMDEFKANLGQPIYIDGMFLGSEFPATQTEVLNNTGFIRYFTGKNFNDFKRDGQLTDDGKYVTWQTVVGASSVDNADGNNLDIVKQSFFNYIDGIATPSDFRIQYNSWFDNMMRITDENILSSFSAIDKHLSATGVRPLDSYVVDDGWNIYRQNPGDLQSAIDIERNGKDDVNEVGFWTFNSKFPNGLTPSSQLVQNFGSNFGVWIGPRGGYNYQGHIARIIEKAGNGSAAGGSIDVADERYVKKFKTDLAIKWQNDYKVNYWKWDGFADRAQFNHFPSGEGVVGYDEDHHHMYGGVQHMYHVTDLWEKWIDLFKEVRENEKSQGIHKLWISLTCYVNPSPWYLQWANSVWLQCVADRGERTNGNPNMSDKMNAMLTYRDGAYYDFTVNHKFQFPLANIYNHDPIYGTEGTGIDANSMNGEQFRNYMFMQGTRGTAFWELYYSDSILNEEKYLVNADFLEWAEHNFSMLRNAIMIGGTPSSTATLTGGVHGNAGEQEAYGFSGFNNNGTEGIISMRNPSATEKNIEFTLDSAIGVKTTKGTTYHVTTDHKFIPESVQTNANIPTTVKQGDKVTVTLQPGETYVLHFNTNKDNKSPEIDKLYIKDNKIVQVQTNEHVTDANFTVTVNGKEVTVEATKNYADLRTFDLTLKQSLENGQNVVVNAKSGKDAANNQLTGSATLDFYENGVITSKSKVKENQKLSEKEASVKGKNGFSVSMTVQTKQNDVVLLSQGDEYKLGIDKNGHAYFELNGTRATSNKVVNTNEEYLLTGVKENNGIIKLYVDGKVDKSAYEAKNKEYPVKAAPIMVNGDNNVITKVEVTNRALGYDEVPTLPLEKLITKVESEKALYTTESWGNAKIDELLVSAKAALETGKYADRKEAYDKLWNAYKQLIPSNQINLALNKKVTARWLDNTINDNPTNSGSPLQNALDGKKDNSDSYAIIGKDGIETPVYMELDLGESYDLKRVQLYRYWKDSRTYDSTALVVSNNPEFKDSKVLYYSGKNTRATNDVFHLGVNPKDQLYEESNKGKELYNGEFVNARYVRLYVSGKANSNTPTENHIVELEVYGRTSDPYNLAEFEKLVKDAEVLAKNEALYTKNSIKTLNDAITNSKKVIEEVKADKQIDKTIGYVLTAKEELVNAMEGLVENPDLTPIEPSNPDLGKPELEKPELGGSVVPDNGNDGINKTPPTGDTTSYSLLWMLVLASGTTILATKKSKKV